MATDIEKIKIVDYREATDTLRDHERLVNQLADKGRKEFLSTIAFLNSTPKHPEHLALIQENQILSNRVNELESAMRVAGVSIPKTDEEKAVESASIEATAAKLDETKDSIKASDLDPGLEDSDGH